VVKTISELDRYRWCGHSVVMGRRKHEWQDSDYVLSWFGEKEGDARRAYRQYVEEGAKKDSTGVLQFFINSCEGLPRGLELQIVEIAIWGLKCFIVCILEPCLCTI